MAVTECPSIDLLEERVLRLAVRCDAIEGIAFTITARIFASLDEVEARRIADDLRANIMIGEARLVADGDWDKSESIVLETEAYATRLLDQIEQSAAVLRKSKS